jgi:putative thioredoxin
MSEPQYIFDATPDNFDALVLDNSDKGPVLVNYWAPYAEPCLKLRAELEPLVKEYDGRFLLVNVNTETQGELAERYGINSVPTIKVFRHREVVDSVYGAESAPSLRKLLEKYIAGETDEVLASAINTYQSGDIDGAMQQLREAAEADPFDLRIPLTLAKLLMRHGQFEHAEELLRALPEQAQMYDDVADLLAHLGFIRAAENAPATEELLENLSVDPDDLEARYQLAALLLLNDETEAALEQLFDILERERNYREGGIQKGIAAILNMLGPDDELSREYRKRLFSVIH